MSVLTVPLDAVRASTDVIALAARAATLPARAAIILTCEAAEELLDLAERAKLVEPPDPRPAQRRPANGL